MLPARERMAMEKGEACAALNRLLKRSVQIAGVEAHVPVDLAIARCRRQPSSQKSRVTTHPAGWVPQAECEVFLAVFAHERRVQFVGNGSRHSRGCDFKHR